MVEKSDLNNLQQLPVKEIKNKASKQHADLVSLYQDIKYVIWASEQAIKIFDSDHKDIDNRGQQLSTLWSAALVAYRRCFNSGKRVGLSKEIYRNLPGDPIEAHDYYYSQASKLIAHSVNPFEEVRVGIVVDDSNVIGVSELSSKLISTTKDGYITLRALAVHSLKFLKKKIENSRKEVEESAKKLNDNELSELAEIKYVTPGPEATNTPRE